MSVVEHPDLRQSRELEHGLLAFPQSPRRITESVIFWDDIVYAAEPGYRPLMLDLRVPSHATVTKTVPVVIWVHGGGWHFGSRKRRPPTLDQYQVIDKIVENGFAVAIIDYRLIKEARFPAQLADLRAAIRWVRAHASTYFLNPDRLVLFGESAGAHLALLHGLTQSAPKAEPLAMVGEYLTLSEEVHAVVDWYAPSTISEADSNVERPAVFNPEAELVWNSDWNADQLSPLSRVHSDAPPIFIAHGRDDDVVSVDHSRHLSEALRQAGAKVRYLETEGGHVFNGSTVVNDVLHETLDFMNQVSM